MAELGLVSAAPRKSADPVVAAARNAALTHMSGCSVCKARQRTAVITTTAATAQNGKEIAVKMNAKQLDVLSWVFDGQYITAVGNTALIRIVIPMGQIISIGDVDLTNKMVSALEVTTKAYPDPAGNHGYMYLNDGAITGGTSGS